MSIQRVEVALKAHLADARGEGVRRAAAQIGITSLAGVRVSDIYWIEGDLGTDDIARLVRHALVDPVVETLVESGVETADGFDASAPSATHAAAEGFVEVALLPGVTDPVAETVVHAAHLIRIDGPVRAATGRRYTFSGTLGAPELEALTTKVLANAIIERFAIGRPLVPAFGDADHAAAPLEYVPVRHVGDDGLMRVSRERRLSLDLAEMRAIAAHFAELRREPTDLELEMLAQTWSEHCVHKTFRARIKMREWNADGTHSDRVIDGLLKSTIRAATERLARPWVHSAFVDNAGIVAFDDDYDLAIKVETHNRPSALEPFGGANTGLGGVIRDVLGVSARPIAGIDVLCFGPPDLPFAELPAGVLHPRRVRDGVIHGIEDYGNKMGIPTVAGAVHYHPAYTTNPLVFAGCLGILPRGSHPTAPQEGDLVVVVGGKTGRDGLRGATFSSETIDGGTGTVSGGAVQIGDPICEKQVLEVILRARDERLYHAITDCGAGGLSSAVGEMGKTLGASVELTHVPLKYPGLAPWEIWLSEAQERMVLAVAPGDWLRLVQIANEHRCHVSAIGTFGGGTLSVTMNGTNVASLGLEFLHDGLPRRELVGEWRAPLLPAWPPAAEELAAGLLQRLASLNIRSREEVVRRYDHEVQGGSVVRPLVGVHHDAPSDAAVLVPLEIHEARVGAERRHGVGGAASERTCGARVAHPELAAAGGPRGLAIAIGLCPEAGLIDPYVMAWRAIDEAVRNAVAVGADPSQIAILDNFSWGDARLPDRCGALVLCAEGCHDAALSYGTPFVSGKDSLNNEWSAPDGTRRAIPPTLVVTALGLLPDATRSVTSDLKAAGDLLYVLGPTSDAVCGPPDAEAPGRYVALHAAMRAGLVVACHDASEGGLGVAIAEMAIGGRLGATFELTAAAPGLRPDRAAFAEDAARHVVEVPPVHAAAFEAALAGHVCRRVGVVTAEPWLALGAARVALAEAVAAFKSARAE